MSARFRPRPGRTHQFAASPFRCTATAVVAGAARTSVSVPLHSEVVKADETVKADTGRAQIANGKNLVAGAPRAARTAHKSSAGLADRARAQPHMKTRNGRETTSGQATELARELRTGKPSAISAHWVFG